MSSSHCFSNQVKHSSGIGRGGVRGGRGVVALDCGSLCRLLLQVQVRGVMAVRVCIWYLASLVLVLRRTPRKSRCSDASPSAGKDYASDTRAVLSYGRQRNQMFRSRHKGQPTAPFFAFKSRLLSRID